MISGSENLMLPFFRYCEGDSVQATQALHRLQPGPHYCGGGEGEGGEYQTPGSVREA